MENRETNYEPLACAPRAVLSNMAPSALQTPHVRGARRALASPRLSVRPSPRQVRPCRALEIDWSDSDTWVGLVAAVLGLGVGIGAPIFYSNRMDVDEQNLEDLRKLNRETFKETGQYLTEVKCSLCWLWTVSFAPDRG
jgi:hypothetical protein